ncbi:type I-F CRISPR-associated protein Csy3 [Thiomicrorhabdus xiamenensis]|uniref:Type I-F CRISPR-associated protein Csy3 n=1 Tax=Thiomicrorhabdus xiamenensis TaxID=2739063 RepID=A0A7D4NP25_9GAMM|nr:type I-F CRISPR-associated protein Csy3 [Thiomicrorhabdus xiamenensis]QKI88151.1 type I-F CRISPR-associated protein Csy3 [Thiomicrorhabdus xiamenensis]
MAKKITASVLAFEKKLVPSDAFMYGTNWAQKNDSKIKHPLALKEKSVRGTISNRLKKALQSDPAKLDAEVEKANLQRVDSCSLNTEQDTLALTFTLKILSGVEQPSACNSEEFLQTYQQAAKDYIDEFGFKELARRYATNLANARFLWRNRIGAEQIEVQVKVLNQGSDAQWTFNALDFSTRSFDSEDRQVEELATQIAQALAGETDFLLLEVNTFALVGMAQDVYPSEELVLDKSSAKGQKSKILYAVDGQAAMHSQKIGNALRCVDTWYPDYEEVNTGPIAVEPYGAVTNLGKAYRAPKQKADFFTLFDRFALGEELDNADEQHYVMAVLVRGGVFGESGKD